MMRGSALIAFALLLGILTFARAEAGGPEACRGEDLTQVEGLAAAEAKRADDLVNAEGLLWRIEKPSLPPSYLYGTIHSTDDLAMEVAERAAREIKGAEGCRDRTRRAIRLYREGQYKRGDAGQGARPRS